MSEQKKQNSPLTIHDAVLALFYIVIVCIGINLCVSRGVDAGIGHLVTVTVCVWGILAVKLYKYRKNIREHLGDILFVALLCGLSVFAIITTVLF